MCAIFCGRPAGRVLQRVALQLIPAGEADPAVAIVPVGDAVPLVAAIAAGLGLVVGAAWVWGVGEPGLGVGGAGAARSWFVERGFHGLRDKGCGQEGKGMGLSLGH